MKTILKTLPPLFVLLFGAEILFTMLPKQDREFHTRSFGRLPVLMNGRIQPFDSVARNSLLQIRSTADVPLEEVPSWKFWHHPKKLRSTDWLLETMFRPEAADERPIFLIHHPDLLAELDLRDKGVEKSGLRYYTYNQLMPVLATIWEQGTQARKVEDDSQRTPLQKQVIKLQNALYLYQNLKFSVRPPQWDDFAKELKEFEKVMPAGVAALAAHEAGTSYDTNAFEKFSDVAMAAIKFKDDPTAGQSYPLVVPPRTSSSSKDDWGNIWAGILDSVRERAMFPPVTYFAAISTAYSKQLAPSFNQAVDDYTAWLADRFPADVKKGRQEYYYNDTKSFLHAMIIYTSAFVLACLAMLCSSVAPGLGEALRRSAFWLILISLVVHTFGLGFRMYLEGRPPVTNLYSSAIFIGWGAVILGIILERIYRLGIGNIVASFAGFVTLLIAHNLALGGDTMEMLRAVLDTNFWLATHVVVVTLGYASTFVAGLLAILYVLLGLFTPILGQKLAPATDLASGPDKPATKALANPADVSIPGQKLPPASASVSGPGKPAARAVGNPADITVGRALSKMVYGIVCFATLFSFTGTVLGGIWADQSWGRFWGWDPKENGALIIVLWNATILHARWGGLVRERGLVNMAIFGNIVTSFSWFGVNMLNIGLHSYGFMDAAFNWLVAFVSSQVILIGLGLVPQEYWRSFRAKTPPTAPGSSTGRRTTAVPVSPAPSPAGT